MDVGGGRHGLLPPTLPFDIIIEILLRLSVKKLTRFCCVCKQWYALISDPYFRRLHIRRSEESPLLLIGWPYRQALDNTINPHKQLTSIDIRHGTIQEEINLPKEVSDDVRYIMGSSAFLDLICLVGNLHVYVCNPTTGELITIPLPPHRGYFANVALGRVPSTKEYKLVNFFTEDFINAGETTCDILTLSGGFTAAAATSAYQWREVEEPPFTLSHCFTPFINGTIYLMADFGYDAHEDGENLMAALDIERETFQVFSPPAFCSNPQHNSFLYEIKLFELEGSLCLADVGHPQSMKVDLWLLKDGNNESRTWVKEYSIDLSVYTAYKNFWGLDGIEPIAIVDGKILMEMPPRKLVYYDPRSKKFSDTEIKLLTPFCGCFYVQNFPSLGSI